MLDNILQTVFLNNTLGEYAYAILIIVVLFALFRTFRLVVVEFLKKLFEKTKNDFDDLIIGLISNISKFFYWFMAFYFGVRELNISEYFMEGINLFFVLFIAFEVVIILQQVIDYFVDLFANKKDKSSKAVFNAIGKFAKWSLWIVALLLILSNYGVNVTALATGLGIGGVAIAFALQGILKDLFSYFTILLDKPIRIGDYIYLGDKKGKVKSIGLKTTRLTAVDGEEIIVANDIITGTDFKNFGKTKTRRVVYTIGAAYDTPVKTLKSLKNKIIKIIESHNENVDLERCHLKNMGSSSLDYEAVYHVKVRDYTLYMDINEDINLRILELFEKEGVEIPYPTQTIYRK